MFIGIFDPTKPTRSAEKARLLTRCAQEMLRAGGACYMRICMPCSFFMSQHVFSYACYFIFTRHGMPRGFQPRFPRASDFGGSQESDLTPRAAAVTQLGHACIIFHAISDIYAACCAARTHIVLAWDRSLPRPGLAEAFRAARMHAACSFLHALFAA